MYIYTKLSTILNSIFIRPWIWTWRWTWRWTWSWLHIVWPQHKYIKDDTETKTNKKKPDPPPPYEDKYKEKYKDIVSYVDNNEEYKERNTPIPLTLFVMEFTPSGLVIMRYNEESKVFEYYCDRSTIVHKYLEVVSRKYTITFICPQIYSVMDKEIELCDETFKIEKVKRLEREKQKKEKDENDKKNGIIPKKSVFARLKNTPLAKTQTRPPTKSVINQYLRIGHTSDFNPLIPVLNRASTQNQTQIGDPETYVTLVPGSSSNSSEKQLSYQDFLKNSTSTGRQYIFPVFE